MKRVHVNPFETMVELELNPGSTDDLFAATEIFADLRCAEEEIEFEDFSFFVGISRAHLALELSGCDIVPGSRLNDQSVANQHLSVSHQTKATRKSGMAISVDATTRDTELLRGGAVLDFRTEKESVTLTEQSNKRHFVTCRPGKKWEIKDPSDLPSPEPLIGTLLLSDRVCQIERRDGSNSVEVVARINVRRRDLTFRTEGNALTREFRNLRYKERFMKAVIAKALVENTSQLSVETQLGAIVVAKSSINSDE